MSPKEVVLPPAITLREMQQSLRIDHRQEQRLLPVVDDAGKLVGVLTRGDIHERLEREGPAALQRSMAELVRGETVEAFPDEPVRMVVYRMAEKSLTRMPVVDRATRKFLGLVSLDDLLKARARHLEEERRRDRPLTLKFLLPRGGKEREVVSTN
jgi:chloride channel protein, CIC family